MRAEIEGNSAVELNNFQILRQGDHSWHSLRYDFSRSREEITMATPNRRDARRNLGGMRMSVACEIHGWAQLKIRLAVLEVTWSKIECHTDSDPIGRWPNSIAYVVEPQSIWHNAAF
jgi:hypothetical protein